MDRTKINAQRREYYNRRPDVYRKSAAKYEAANRVAINARHRAYTARCPERYLLTIARYRAKRAGVPFAIELVDIIIPRRCPMLGLVLRPGKGKMHAASPTLDRKIPALGYVPGNIEVISWRANWIKNNASAAELQAVAEWVSR